MKNVKFGTFSYTFPSKKVQVHVRVSLLVQNMQRGICNIRTKKTDHTKLFEILPQFFHCIVDLFKRLVLDPLVVTDLYSLLINIIFYFIDDLFKLLFDCYKLIFNQFRDSFFRGHFDFVCPLKVLCRVVCWSVESQLQPWKTTVTLTGTLAGQPGAKIILENLAVHCLHYFNKYLLLSFVQLQHSWRQIILFQIKFFNHFLT